MIKKDENHRVFNIIEYHQNTLQKNGLASASTAQPFGVVEPEVNKLSKKN
jgi:hypothetical protein